MFLSRGQKACFPACQEIPASHGEGIDFTLENARVLRFRHGHDNGPSVADQEAPGGEWFQG